MFFFNACLEATVGIAELKTRTVGQFLELKDKFDLCGIYVTLVLEKNILKLKPLLLGKNIFLVLSSKDWITFLFRKTSGKNKKSRHFKRSFNSSFASFLVAVKRCGVSQRSRYLEI